MFSSTLVAAEVHLEWHRMPSIPDSIGVAGAFAGVSRNALLVAGGANFPDKMPWEGGAKVWHDEVFVLDRQDGAWKTGSKLPYPVAYGVSVTTPDGVLCIGGSDPVRHLTNVFLLQWNGTNVRIRDLPPLPLPMANSCGARVGDSVYVAGGTETPNAAVALKKFFRLRLKPGSVWQELVPWPGPARMLATAAGVNNSFLLMGGADLSSSPDGTVQRQYLKDAYAYTPGRGWKRISDLPHPVVAAANPAPVVEGHQVLLAGGDDGTQVNFEPKSKHPGFPSKVLCYDAKRDCWSIAGENPAPRATLATAHWKRSWIMPSGEVKPGVRSPEVWMLQAK